MRKMVVAAVAIAGNNRQLSAALAYSKVMRALERRYKTRCPKQETNDSSFSHFSDRSYLVRANVPERPHSATI